MSDLLPSLLASDTYLPHGQCLLWRSELLWLHAVSDALITAAYYSIPVTLGYFIYKRRDVVFPWMFLLFGTFIFLCGTTHLVGVWTLWTPAYWMDGIVKVLTAAVSMATAILLVPLVPKALALPSPTQLEEANRALRREAFERERVQESLTSHVRELARANADLERFNRTVVGRELQMIELKRKINHLLDAAGKPPAYDLSFVQEEPAS